MGSSILQMLALILTILISECCYSHIPGEEGNSVILNKGHAANIGRAELNLGGPKASHSMLSNPF